MKAIETSRSRAGFAFLLVFLLLAAGIVTTGWFYYRNYEQHYRTEMERQLSAIAELKVDELVQWRKERLGDAEILNTPAFSALVRRFFGKPEDADAQRLLQTWLNKYQAHLNYERVFLTDTQGVIRMSAPEASPVVVPHLARDTAAGLSSGQIAFLDLHRDSPDGPAHMAITVPIFDEQDGRRPLGLIALRIDPETYLYPFIKRWPTPSRTAETLLVRREGNEAVFLNELRFQTNTALNLRMPLDRIALPAAQAALGREGVMEGIDYQGVPVVAALRTIPDSPWALVARMDTAEVYAPLRAQLWQVVVMIGLLLLGAGACVGLVWRHQGVRFYRESAEATEALRASELQYRRLFETAKDGILILDAETGMVVDVNPFLVELLGYSREALFGKKIWELGFLKDIIANQDNFTELQQKGYVRYEDMALETSDGRRSEVEFVSNLYLVNHHKVIQCNIRDITERKHAEDKTHRLNAELEQRVVERTAELAAANKELEAFCYSVSHDLRAPLRGLDGFSHALLEDYGGKLGDEGKHLLQRIRAGSQHMSQLIDDLLNLSRLSRSELHREPVNLSGLAADVADELRERDPHRDVALRIAENLTADGDPHLLRVVLENLLGNAWKYTVKRPQATIEFGLGCDNGHSSFFVRDDGVGFDMQYADKLFTPFRRLHAMNEFPGTGIGLATVQRIVHRHGGRVWAQAEVNKGATFHFTLS